ncbi:MAG: glycoside hydrolase [Verrucomicrobiota bacterium]
MRPIPTSMFLAWLSAALALSSAQALEIKNKFVSLKIDEATSLAEVADLKTGTVYKQSPDFEVSKIQGVKVAAQKDGAKVTFTFEKLPVTLIYKLAADAPVLDATLDMDPAQKIQTVRFPVPFTVSKKGFEWVMPEGYGMLFKVDNPVLPEKSPKGIMKHCVEWAGLFQPQTGEGYTLILKDYYHGALALNLRQIEGQPTLVPEISFGGYLGKFQEPRNLRFIFQQSGGYVNISLNVRKHLMEGGHYRSLADKEKDNPAIAKLRGAPVFWIYVSRTGMENVYKILDDMVASGMDKGIVALGFNFYVSPEEARKLQQKYNFLFGIYDNYFDVLPKEWWKGADETKLGWMERYKRIGHIPEHVALNERGEPRFSKGPNSNRYVGSPATLMEAAKERLEAELADYHFVYRFFDVSPGAALWLDQDYNPQHPVTPRGSMEARLQMFKYFYDHKMILGGEGGDAWATPYFTVSEGGMSVYHMVGRLDPVAPNDEFKNFNMSPQKRVPANGIIYGDARVATWAWGDNTLIQPEYMLMKDLFNILYGTTASYHIDNRTYWKKKENILESYRRVMPFYNQVFGAALVNHRWLTPDRNVQQSDFSNGWHAVVNFGTQEFALNAKVKIAPMGFHTWQSGPEAPSQGQ